MTAQVCSSETAIETADIDSAAPSFAETSSDAMSMVESVARVVSGFSVIGQARNALDAAGWTATIAANRITVGDHVLAQFLPGRTGAYGPVKARWMVYSIGGTDPVWLVGADRSDGSSPAAGNR